MKRMSLTGLSSDGRHHPGEVDAVVNAANSTFWEVRGDGMIHWAAGSGLLEECRKIGWCPPASEDYRRLQPTCSPRYPCGGSGIQYDGSDSPRLLSSCYESCLTLPRRTGQKPSLSRPSAALIGVSGPWSLPDCPGYDLALPGDA